MCLGNMHRYYVSVMLALLASVLFASHATSAQLQQLPGAAEPGRKSPPRLTVPTAPAVLEWSVQLPPGAEPPAALKAETLTLTDIKLVGVTVYRREQLADLFQPYLGKEISFDQFYGISRAIQGRYRKDGYILSFSYVPPQTVVGGVFTIAVVEGFVERVQISDIEGPLKKTLEQHLAPISLSRPLNVAVLERYLLLANDLAGLKVTGVLRPSKKTRGATVLVAKVRRRPFQASTAIDNRSTEFTGPWSATADVTTNSVFGTGERLNLNANQTSRLKEKTAVSASLRQPIGTDGLRADLAATYSRSKPGFTLAEFDIETMSYEFSADLFYPVIRSRAQSLSIAGGFVYRNSEVDLLDAPFNRDRLRLLRAKLNYSKSGFLGGSSRIVLGVTQALAILNASDPAVETTSRADAHPYFTKANLDVVHQIALYRGLGLRLSVSGQYARAPASEEFSIGGDGFGRAYNSGELTGEDGIAAAAELSYNIQSRIDHFDYIQPYGFYDFGKAWDKSSTASLGLKQSLSSAGIGIRLGFLKGLTARLEYNYPLTREPSNQSSEKHGRLFFFTGWRY
jgi:hemolysin activation/secretion protein